MIKRKKMIFIFMSIFLCLLFIVCNFCVSSVYAGNITVEGGYTDVLQDLQTDKDFDMDNYPAIKDDYTLQVIQIAESSDNELFVYVYQPSGNHAELKAVSINISLGLHTENVKNYKLLKLNSNGVFGKYLVKDLIVSNDETRYYEIISIYRNFSEDYDKNVIFEILDEIAFKVAKQYTFTTHEGKTIVGCADIQVITITDKYVGLLRYWDSLFHMTDNHFIAFNTDIPIEKLYSARVSFVSQEAYIKFYSTPEGDYRDWSWQYKEPKEEISVLNSGQTEQIVIKGDFSSRKHTWDTIQTIDEFLETENVTNVNDLCIVDSVTEQGITEDGLNDLKDKQWVLRFTSQDIDIPFQYPVEVTMTNVTEVTVLTLNFETDGVVYNLGVVDNKNTGDGIPDNYSKTTFEIKDSVKVILILLLLIVLGVFLGPILPYMIKFIIWVISLPFKFLKWLFNSSRNRKSKRTRK